MGIGAWVRPAQRGHRGWLFRGAEALGEELVADLPQEAGFPRFCRRQVHRVASLSVSGLFIYAYIVE